MKRQMRSQYLILSGLLFTFFYTWSSAFSLISLWLNQTLGLRGTDTGVFFSMVAATALCMQPLYGFVQDKLGLKKNLLWVIGVLLLLSGPWFIFVCTPLLHSWMLAGAVMMGIYVGATFFAGVGLLESYTERVSRIAGFEYGRARMCGSLGWAVATFLAGMLFNINPELNFWMASISAAIFLLLLRQLKEVKTAALNQLEYGKTSAIKLEQAFALLKTSRFWSLVVFIIGVSFYNVYDQQFPVYFSSLFTSAQRGNEMYGLLNAFQVFLEAGGMFLAPVLVNKIGAKNGLLLSGFVMAGRIFGSGLADDAVTISLMKLLHAVELPILLIALFKYIATHFDARLSATLYLVGFQFISSVVTSLLSPLAGKSYDLYGFADTYMIFGAIVMTLTVIASFLLQGNLASGNNVIPAKEAIR